MFEIEVSTTFKKKAVHRVKKQFDENAVVEAQVFIYFIDDLCGRLKTRFLIEQNIQIFCEIDDISPNSFISLKTDLWCEKFCISLAEYIMRKKMCVEVRSFAKVYQNLKLKKSSHSIQDSENKSDWGESEMDDSWLHHQNSAKVQYRIVYKIVYKI